MATSVGLAAPTIMQFFNNQGQPNAGGSILTQVGGVNYATYQDNLGATPLPNPIPLNSRGEVSNAAGASCQLFLALGVVYTFTLYDVNSNQLNQATYVAAATGGAAGSATAFPTKNILLTSTAALPATYVQALCISSTDSAVYTLPQITAINQDGASMMFECLTNLTHGFTIQAFSGDTLLLPNGVSSLLLQVQGDSCWLVCNLSTTTWEPVKMPLGYFTGWQG